VATGLLGLGSLLAAHAPEASTATQDPNAQMQQVELVRLVDRFAQKLQLEVRFEPGQLTGTVATRPLENLSDAELWSLTHRALESQGLTTIQLPGEEAITIVKLDEAGNRARFEQQDLSKAKAGYVKVLHELGHRSPADVLPTIQQIMSGSGVWAMAVGKTNSILLADLRPKLDQVFELLRVLDVEPPAIGQPIRVFPIRNRSALELADFLNRLAGTGFLGPTGPATQVPDPAAVPLSPATQVTPLPVTPLPATALRAELGRVVLSADATTNCVFAIGDAGLLDKLEGLLKTLDVISSQVMLEVLILNLSDSDATDLGVEIRSIKDSGTIVSLTSLFGLGAPNPAAGLVPPIASGFTSVVLNPGDYSVLLNALQVLNRGAHSTSRGSS
jgi:type II secretory pathway component GspD/PulD (secretin)